MTTTVATTCGARGRKGTPCKRPAGWGTDHPGYGTCKLHLGASQKHSKAAARLEALSFARGQLGQELDVDPLEGVLIAVRLSYGQVDYWRHQLAKDTPNEGVLHEHYSKALMDYTRICEIAIKAGISERQIKILERASEALALFYEELAAAIGGLSAEQHARGAVAWAGLISRLEAPAIEGTARDVAA